jgi:serine/threonine protein kinase
LDVPAEIQPRLESAIGQRYEVLGPIGRGGMASVYLARHRVHGGFCAVKVLADHLAKQPPLVKSFLTEARASASLDGHPNIVNIVDIDEHAGLYYMIMKYIEGEDLSTYLKRKESLPWKQAAYIAAETAEALAFSHDRGVIHRDLKPSNIRLNRRGGIIVMDFGIAKVGQTPSSFTEMGTRAGTPHYMAPEQIRGDKVDHRSDLYGLGVILYQMATGSRPFTGNNPALIWEAHLSQQPDPPQAIEPSIPDPLNHIILTLLAKDADNRYDSAARLVRHLRTLGLEGVAATLDPVDELDLDHLRTQEIRARQIERRPEPPASITETGVSDGPGVQAAPPEPDETAMTSAPGTPAPDYTAPVPIAATPAAETAATPAEAPEPAAPVSAPEAIAAPEAPPAPEPPVSEPTPALPEEPPAFQPPPAPPAPLVQTSSVPTLPPPARKPVPRAPDTKPFQLAPSGNRTPLIVGAGVVAALAIGAFLFLRPGSPSAAPPVTAEEPGSSVNEAPETPAPGTAAGEAAAAAPLPAVKTPPPAAQSAPAAPPRPARPRTGAVYFRTDPAGARIQVDSRPDWSCESPCWLEELSPGQHSVTARMEGYRVAIKRLEVAAGGREPLQLTLEADLISAMIASTPPGAEIYIDGTKRTETTNARIALKPGTYQVKVVLPGVAEGEQALVVSESQMPYANFVLKGQ